MEVKDSPRLLRSDAVRQMFDIPESTMRKQLAAGTFPIKPVRVGRQFRFKRHEVEAFLASPSEPEEDNAA